MTKVSLLGSFLLIASICIAYMLLEVGVPTTVNAGRTAEIVGLGIFISLLIEYTRGKKNILRADILAILGLYFLTLYEFLFDQQALNQKISPTQAYGGLQLILIGLLFLVLGRHLYFRKESSQQQVEGNPNVKLLVKLYYLCFLLGFLYILIKVDFNPFTMIEEAMGPRFSQPWSRGRFGGWFVFLSELQLFTYAVPPLAGIIFHYRKELSGFQFFSISILLLVTLFMGFVGGTRNVFVSYLVGFMGGYVLSMKPLTLRRLIAPSAIVLVMAYVGITYMFQFRSIGLIKYMKGHREMAIEQDRVYVDHNLYTIGLLRQSFPGNHEYLGAEVFVWALIKPVPRALWPSKPKGLSVSMEEAAGIEGYTLAATYIGESYMAGGIPAVIFISLYFGYLAARWNSRASGKLTNEKLLIYALGLFVVVITMRSLFMFTTAVLPIMGVSVLLRYLHRNGK